MSLLVAQRQDDGGVIGLGDVSLGWERQPQHRNGIAPTRELIRQLRDRGDRLDGVSTRPPHPPEREIIEGASVTASTAAKPTPNRPTVPAGSSSRFAARSVDSASTPAGSNRARR